MVTPAMNPGRGFLKKVNDPFMNINDEIQKATDVFIEKQLPELISQKVAKMTDGILDDIFRSYGDTAKLIKEKIEKQLDINLQVFKMHDYNTFVAKAITDRLTALINTETIKPIMTFVDEIVGFVEKKEIKLSAIRDMAIAANKEEHDQKSEGSISFCIEEDTRYGWIVVGIDFEKNKSLMECKLRFTIGNREDSSMFGKIFYFGTGSYMSNPVQLTPLSLSGLTTFEHAIFRLYAAQVNIIIDDCDPDDNYWTRYD